MAQKKKTSRKSKAKKKTTRKKTKSKAGTSTKKRSKKSKKSSGPGAPTKFTPETREKIYLSLHECPFFTTAAGQAGISVRVIHNWLEQGEKDSEEGKETDFVEFLHRVNALLAVAEIGLFGVVKRESKKNWLAARYLLQCMNARIYATKAAVRVEDSKVNDGDSVFDGQNIHKELVGLLDEIEESD